MKLSTKIMLLVIALCTLLSTAGVYATWNYSTVSGDGNVQIPIKLATFEYPKEQIPDTVKGVLGAIVKDMNIKDTTGIFGTTKINSEVRYAIQRRKTGQDLNMGNLDSWQRGMMGSMDLNYGNDMVNSLKQQYTSYPDGCSFIIDYSTDNSYSVYIYVKKPGDPDLSSLEQGVSISPVYKTTVVNDGNSWKASDEYAVGSAVTAIYKTPQYWGTPLESMGFDYREM